VAQGSKNRHRASALVAAVGVIAAGLVAAARARWPSPSTEPPKQPSSLEISSDLEEQLSKCRFYSAGSTGTEPDWNKAETACNGALDRDPINEEANRLLKQIKQEQNASELFARADSASQRLDDLGALDLLTQIPEASVYFKKARPQAMELKKRVRKRLEVDCADHLRARHWQLAQVTCEKYIGLACQDSTAGEWDAGVGFTPTKDRLYRLFLHARSKVNSRAGPWRCPEKKLLRESGEALEVQRRVDGALMQRFPDARIGRALVSYWQGNLRESLTALQKVAADPKGTDLHAIAAQLRNRIWLVLQFLKSGNTALQARDPERAAKPFRAALDHDREVLGRLEESPSFVDRSIRREMGSHCYQRGKYWADRADTRRACRIWRLGYGFSPANLALLQALKHCTERGGELLDSARRCGELAIAAELSSDGDGLAEKLESKRAALGCP